MTESPADMHPDRDLLPFYLNQTLSTAIRREVEAHLIRCPECREALAEWARIAQGVEQAAGQNVASLNATPPPLSPLVRLSLQPRPSLRQAAHSAWNLVWGQRVIFERSVSFPALGILVVVGILISLEVQTSTSAGSPLLFLGWVPIPFSEWGAIPPSPSSRSLPPC
jgi:anti-sigma factor RsiW